MRKSAFLLCLVPVLAFGSSVTFFTPSGSTTSGGPVSDQVSFTTTAGSLVITLTNLQPNPTDVAQLLSDLSFTLSNGSLAGSSLGSNTGQNITVNDGGTFALGSTVSTGWEYSFSSNTSGLLNVLGTPIGPAHLIIGPPGGATYVNANGSIAGIGPHNPFLNQTAMFTVTGGGITADTTITGATFSFGTNPDLPPGTTVVGVVPEPRTTGLMISTLGLIGILQYRRKKAQSAV